MRLYDLPHEIERLNAAIDANGGELSPEIEAELDALMAAACQRSDDVAAWIRDLKALAEAERLEADHFVKRKRSHANLADRLSAKLLEVMQALGVDRLKGRFTLSDRRSGTPSIRWVGQGDVPERYRRITVEFDGKKALEDYRAGSLPTEGFEVVFSHWLDIR